MFWNNNDILFSNNLLHFFSSIFFSSNTNNTCLQKGSRSRDDCDMAVALRPRGNHPDVVKSTLSSRDLRINEATIDSIFGAPGKIHIPERYIPDTVSDR